ncbi:MAG: hypothetical protein BWZ02_00150 [Lentisphaerae bacterium ADurb.BinA184]|nr:MAG: hypothetical protein BWZ02_00150 [Lentisphaerae bacterium ADurb.BinA184]
MHVRTQFTRLAVLALASFATLALHAGTFAPTEISGIRMWLDASAITGVSDGDRLNRWEDGSANNVDAGTYYSRYGNLGDRSPRYKTDIVSGRPVVRFDPTEVDADTRDVMFTGSAWTVTGSDLSLSQPATLVTVYAPRSAAGDAANWAFSSDQVMYQSNRVASQTPFVPWITSVNESQYTFNVDAVTFQGKDVELSAFAQPSGPLRESRGGLLHFGAR